MLFGFSEICQAGKVLRRDKVSPEALAAAGRYFWTAFYEEETWPKELRERARRIVLRLLRDGELAVTIANLTDHEVAEIWAEMLTFVEEAERAEDAFDFANASPALA